MTSTPLNLKSVDTKLNTAAQLKKWQILIVDDDHDVHAVTRMILSDRVYKGREIELLSAYSSAEAREVLERDHDIALVLLDVVMETDDAGLQLVKIIREDLKNEAIRIILRTGQPGQAPEEKVIVDYDINDYKAKSELTAQKLFTAVVAALRSFETIMLLEKTRLGLEKIIHAANALFEISSLEKFASGVLTQLSAFLDCQPDGIVCAKFASDEIYKEKIELSGLRILASTGESNSCIECTEDKKCPHHKKIFDLAYEALEQRKSALNAEYTVLYFDTGEAHTEATVVLLHGGSEIIESDRKLLALFASNISIALANAVHYHKMMTSEHAATIDFLTGLDNRRQLLRLGKPLVAGAVRSTQPLALAMLDIDHFKLINDKWGHTAGDQVLQRVGALLKDRFRTSDVIARFGGEEFCIIATGVKSTAAFQLFDDFRQLLEQETFDFDGETRSITISIGVTTDLDANIDNMISTADARLYQAKEAGRNCVVLN